MTVQEIGGVVPDGVMRTLGRALGVRDEEAEDGDVEMGEAKGVGRFERVRMAVEKVTREGYSAVQVLSQVCLGLRSLLTSVLTVFRSASSTT